MTGTSTEAVDGRATSQTTSQATENRISSRFAVWSRLNSGHARLVGGLSAPWSAYRAVDGVRHPAGERIGRGKAGDHRAQAAGAAAVAVTNASRIGSSGRPVQPRCRHSRRWRRVGHT